MSQYGDAAQVTLGSVGGTPKRVVYDPLDTLVRTRDHDIVRAESKKLSMPLSNVTAGDTGNKDEDSYDDFHIEYL